MKPTPIHQKDFNEILEKTTRFWDGLRGLSRNQFKDSGKSFEEIKYIFVRNDGWKIASDETGYNEAYRLWPDEWEAIYRPYQTGDKITVLPEIFSI